MRNRLHEILETIRLVKEGLLDADPRFVSSSLNVLLATCNGCGHAGSKFDFVPDTIYLMPIYPACHIHDFDYHHGLVIDHKHSADRRFIDNLLRLINAHSSNALTRRLRRRRALTYYNAVADFGGPAFWSGKTTE